MKNRSVGPCYQIESSPTRDWHLKLERLIVRYTLAVNARAPLKNLDTLFIFCQTSETALMLPSNPTKPTAFIATHSTNVRTEVHWAEAFGTWLRPRILHTVLIFMTFMGFAQAGDDTAKTLSKGGESTKVVIELFTSQGCSSCPPADRLLKQYVDRPDVYALSLPVDYWDYLGWTDTLASPKFSARQRAYARTRGDGSVYTPQIVVGGALHVNGQKARDIDAGIDRVKAWLSSRHVSIEAAMQEDSIVIKVGGRPSDNEEARKSPRRGTIWLARYSKAAEVAIRRGENRGRTITYYNVVRELSPVGQWRGEALELSLPKKALMPEGSDGCVVLLQHGETGPIIGAAEMRGW